MKIGATIVPLTVISAALVWAYFLPAKLNTERITARQADFEAHNPNLIAKLQGAEADLIAKIAKDPSYAPNWFDLGTDKKILGDYIGAEYYLNHDIQIDQVSLTGLNNLGLMFEEEGRYQDAEHQYLEMIRRTPSDVDGYQLLTTLYLSGKFRGRKEAEQVLMRGVTLSNGDPKVIALLRDYYQNQNMLDKLEALKKKWPTLNL